MTVPAKHGAECDNHEGRPAQVVCPLCERSYCVLCYHSEFERCEGCLRANPASAVPALPFESKTVPRLRAVLATLGSALHPAYSAPAFARPELSPALRFFLLTALPLSLLAGVIPHTRLLVFGAMRIQVVGQPGPLDIALDVTRAMGVQVLFDGIVLLSLWAPFVSLVRAYAGDDSAVFARRALLYRGYLIPAATLLFSLLVAAFAPPEEGQTPSRLLGSLLILPLLLPLLLVISMGFTARLACGLGYGWSMVIVGIAVIVAFLVSPPAMALVGSLLPALAT